MRVGLPDRVRTGPPSWAVFRRWPSAGRKTAVASVYKPQPGLFHLAFSVPLPVKSQRRTKAVEKLGDRALSSSVHLRICLPFSVMLLSHAIASNSPSSGVGRSPTSDTARTAGEPPSADLRGPPPSTRRPLVACSSLAALRSDNCGGRPAKLNRLDRGLQQRGALEPLWVPWQDGNVVRDSPEILHVLIVPDNL